MKTIKRIAGIMFAIVISFVGLIKTNAVDNSIKFHNEYMQGVITIYGAGSTYKEVTTSGGVKIGYCFNMKLNAPPEGSTLVKASNGILPNAAKTNMLIYILDNGYGGSWNTSVIKGSYTKYQKYYITQLAVWMTQGSLNPTTVKNSGTLGNAAYQLYTAAQKNSGVIAYEPKVSLSGNTTMTKSGSNYVSGNIKLSVAGASNAVVSLTNAPAGSAIIVNGVSKSTKATLTAGTTFKISVPVSKVTKNTTITANATTTATRKKIQIYKYQQNDNYQNIGLIFKEKYTAKDNISATIKPVGELQVLKVTLNNNAETKLGGAVLAVKDSTGKVVAEWNTSKENPKKLTNLPLGAKYTVYEKTDPNGYKKAGSVTVTIGSTAKVVKIYNFKTNPIKISKQDITNKAELPGAHLVLKNSNGTVVDEWTSSNEPHYITKKLPAGTYTLSETIAPKGYELSTETISFKVDANGETEKDIVMYNSPEKTTPVKISKQDITNKSELPGAKLVLKDANGNVIEEWTSTNEPHYVTLKAGTYYLSETIAPEGYKLSTETISFTVNKDGKVDKDVVMYNTPKKGVIISKQDVATSKELPGATLVLKDANGKIIEKWVSTNKPHFIADLEEGTYTLIETKAPKGYGLSDEVITFEIKYDGKETQKVVMYNSQIPDTADINFNMIIGTLIVAISAGVFAVFRLKKHA